MTMEDRLVIDVADLQTVRFVCTKCAAAVAIPVKDFHALQHDCPGCGRRWLTEQGPFAKATERLIYSLRELAVTADDQLIRVGFDLSTRKP